MRLLPREEKFFHYFVEQSQLIRQAATEFREAAEKGPSVLREAEVAIATLFRELPGLRLADPVCHTFQGANPSVRRPETLRVTIDR